jgi:hypothetical protein
MFRRKRFLNFLGVKGWGAIFRRKRFLNRTFNVFSKEEEEANLPVPCQYVISTCPGARCPSILTPTETSSYGDLYQAVVLAVVVCQSPSPASSPDSILNPRLEDYSLPSLRTQEPGPRR